MAEWRRGAWRRCLWYSVSMLKRSSSSLVMLAGRGCLKLTENLSLSSLALQQRVFQSLYSTLESNLDNRKYWKCFWKDGEKSQRVWRTNSYL